MSIPCWRASSTLLGAYGSPFSHIVPESGLWKPHRILISVDLPAPLSPSNPSTSPLRRCRLMSRSALIGPKLLRDVLDPQHVVVGRLRADDPLLGNLDVSHGPTPSAPGRRRC